MKDMVKQKKNQHLWYLRHKDSTSYKNKNSEGKARMRKRNRDYISKIKEGAVCADCGRKYPSYVYDFDHRDPNDKFLEVSIIINIYGLERLKKEVAKCDLVCSNCHRIRTFKEARQFK